MLHVPIVLINLHLFFNAPNFHYCYYCSDEMGRDKLQQQLNKHRCFMIC